MLKKVLCMSSMLVLSSMGFFGMGMMSQCSASEAWDCVCGKKGLTSKFCVECGRPGVGNNDAATQQPSAATKETPHPAIIMQDGPGMANVNAWKHTVLDGGWMAPTGDIDLQIKGFDYKFGIYKKGEPENFRYIENRFYFAGGQNSPNRAERYDLCLSGDTTIKDAEGNVLVTLEEMWHENRSIYMKLKYPNAEEVIVKELRKLKDIVE